MDPIVSRRLSPIPSFAPLRGSLLAALGFTLVACGGNVSVSTGGGGSGGAPGGGGNGGSGGVVVSPCTNPQPILQPNGEPSGFVRCADGAIDRPSPATCAIKLQDTCAGTEDDKACVTAADCTERPNGECVSYSGGEPGPIMTFCGCQYQCQSDADCDAGYICACAGVADAGKAFCIHAADCEVNSDCASGECGFSEYFDGCFTQQVLYCRGSDDSCRIDAQCANSTQGNDCGKDPNYSDTWACLPTGCAIGRPLFSGDALIFAPTERRADWTMASLVPETASLTPELRAALAAHFSAMAAMEHASIGSFARFSLELLALGAPPDLLAAAHQAGVDEIAHARAAYALATVYSDEPRGPGRLPITGVAPSTDPVEIVRALVREACVGETIAAAEALSLATTVTDPVLRQVFGRVSEEEARHAELGWRTLAWMLSETPSLAEAAREAFAEAMSSISADPLVASDIVSPDHGLLSSAALGALRTKAARDVVAPCRDALLARTRLAGEAVSGQAISAS